MPWRLTCSTASSRESTTPTAIFRSRYSVPQSASVAAPTSTPPASSRTRSSPTSSTPAATQVGQSTPGRKSAATAASTSSVSAALQTPGRCTLALIGDPPRHLEVGLGVHVDVAVAGRGVDHRHRRDVLQRVLQPFAAARDQQVDDPLLGRQLRQVLATATDEQQHRVLRQPGLGQRLAHDRRQRSVGALRVAANRAARSRCRS